MKRHENYRETQNIRGDEQVIFDIRKHNQGEDVEKRDPLMHQNETNPKQTNGRPAQHFQ